VNFAGVFIRRPVLSTVLSLLILLLGVQSATNLEIRQYPKVDETVITINTAYPGASAELVQSFIGDPIAKAAASAEGVDYVTSSSVQGRSTVTVQMRLGTNPDTALTEVIAKTQQARRDLPEDAYDPIVIKGTGRTYGLLFISFTSDRMNDLQITEYIKRVVQPRMATIPGVADAAIIGGQDYAMRVWLDPVLLASHDVTAGEVATAIKSANFLSAPGKTENAFTTYSVEADSTLKTPDAFGALPIRGDGDNVVRLRDVAHVELGAASDDVRMITGDRQVVAMAIQPTPSANSVALSEAIRAQLPAIRHELPPGMDAEIFYDQADAIRSAIDEVYKTIGEAVIIVVLVILIFLGSLRSMLIPVVTIPLSLVGALFVLYVLGYSINLLTLLAMVLAIGLVVDDAIVVVENVNRHLEIGKKATQAAIDAMKELFRPIIAMTITLAAVYAPIGFTQGLTGKLFREFAFMLAGAVIISGIIALTLSPMMSARILRRAKPGSAAASFAARVDRSFSRLAAYYARMLSIVLGMRGVVLAALGMILATTIFLYGRIPSELAPPEDIGFIPAISYAPRYSTPEYMVTYLEQLDRAVGKLPEATIHFAFTGFFGENAAISGWVLKPWSKRSRSQFQVMHDVERKAGSVAGLQTAVFAFNTLPGAGGFGVQYVIRSVRSSAEVYEVAEKVREQAMASGRFFFVQNSASYDLPRARILIDRPRAAALGVTVADIGNTLNVLLSENYITRFDRDNRSYDVIPQAPARDRLNPGNLGGYYVRSVSGKMVPLTAVTRVETLAGPATIDQFNQLNSATLTAAPAPGVTLDQAIEGLREAGAQVMPDGFFDDFMGQARLSLSEGHTLALAFGLAVLVIYLVLAAQFESFRDPLIVMMAVPLSIFGALVPLNLGFATLNIYTQVGLITLVGLITKHGILIVEFANERRAEGYSIRAAVEEAARVRLRPILMTTAAMIVGVLPLLAASGAGAEARFSIGLVIFSGMSVGTLFTLFVVPVFYTYIAKRDRAFPEAEPTQLQGAPAQ